MRPVFEKRSYLLEEGWFGSYDRCKIYSQQSPENKINGGTWFYYNLNKALCILEIMPKLALLLPIMLIAQLATSQSLFRIIEKGKTGYINSAGITVIPPIYHNAFDFAEGLAAVRENELYGFIDSSGKYVLPPQFDYATYFVNGITLVYKQRKPYFIDKTGKVILPDVNLQQYH